MHRLAGPRAYGSRIYTSSLQFRSAAAAAGTAAAAWRPPLSRALRHAAQTFRALEYLHGLAPPMIHRDVKPSNLLVTADLQSIKVGDFGVTEPAHKLA